MVTFLWNQKCPCPISFFWSQMGSLLWSQKMFSAGSSRGSIIRMALKASKGQINNKNAFYSLPGLDTAFAMKLKIVWNLIYYRIDIKNDGCVGYQGQKRSTYLFSSYCLSKGSHTMLFSKQGFHHFQYFPCDNQSRTHFLLIFWTIYSKKWLIIISHC